MGVYLYLAKIFLFEPYNKQEIKMLNISSYNYQNNVVAFNGRPRCDIFKCHANCCMNAPIPESYLSKYSDKVVNPVIKTVEMGNIPSQGGKQIIPITTLFNLLKNKCPFLRSDYRCNIYENRPQICREYGTRKNPKSTIFFDLTF